METVELIPVWFYLGRQRILKTHTTLPLNRTIEVPIIGTSKAQVFAYLFCLVTTVDDKPWIKLAIYKCQATTDASK